MSTIQHVDGFIAAIKPFRGKFSKELNESIERVIYDASRYSMSRLDDAIMNESETNRYNYVLMFLVYKGFCLLGYDFKIHIGLTHYKSGGFVHSSAYELTGGDDERDVYDDDGEIKKQCLKCYFCDDNGYGYKRCYLSLSNKCKAGISNFHYWSYKGLNLLTHYIDKVDALLDDDERGYVRTLSRDNANRQTLLAKSFINVFSIELVQRIINKYNFIEKLCNQLIQNHC